MSDAPEGEEWWEASDGKWYAPELRRDLRPPPPTQSAASTGTSQPELSVDSGGTTLVADRPAPPQPAVVQIPPRKRKLWPIAVGLLALAAAGATAWLVLGGGGDNAEGAYVNALDAAAANDWATERAAVNAGHVVCERLDGGAPARGSAVDLIAVQHLCPDFESAFRVLDEKTIEGTFTVFDSDEFKFESDGASCYPDGGYGDVSSSTQVVVRNGEGSELARTSLGSGSIGLLKGCEFTFDLQLTEGETVYVLLVGDRGEISYSWEELLEPEAVALSLGDPLD